MVSIHRKCKVILRKNAVNSRAIRRKHHWPKLQPHTFSQSGARPSGDAEMVVPGRLHLHLFEQLGGAICGPLHDHDSREGDAAQSSGALANCPVASVAVKMVRRPDASPTARRIQFLPVHWRHSTRAECIFCYPLLSTIPTATVMPAASAIALNLRGSLSARGSKWVAPT